MPWNCRWEQFGHLIKKFRLINLMVTLCVHNSFSGIFPAASKINFGAGDWACFTVSLNRNRTLRGCVVLLSEVAALTGLGSYETGICLYQQPVFYRKAVDACGVVF